MNKEEIINNLRDSKIFRGLSDTELNTIYEYGTLAVYEKNDVLYQEGQHEHPLYVVMSGRVEIVLPKEGDSQGLERFSMIKLSKLHAGDCIGEYSVFDNKPASATVMAFEHSKLFRIERADFIKIINSSDATAKTIYFNLLQILIERARENNKELELLVLLG
jgi:CRP-like cAMP-binding protein